MPSDPKSELVEYVIRRAFDPVIAATPSGRSEMEKRRLAHVQDATRAAIERYRHYDSAAEVVANFRRDLSSRPAKKLHAELNRLGLPTIDELRDAFEQKARELRVDGT